MELTGVDYDQMLQSGGRVKGEELWGTNLVVKFK